MIIGLKCVSEELHFLDGSVWIVGLTVEIKLLFSNSFGVVCTVSECPQPYWTLLEKRTLTQEDTYKCNESVFVHL